MKQVRKVYDKGGAFSRPKLVIVGVQERLQKRGNINFTCLILAIFGGVMLILAILLVVPTAVIKPPVVNITRQQYDDALAKWRASGIVEYEITSDTIAFPGAGSNLRVNNRTGTILVRRSSSEPFFTPDPDMLDYYHRETVEGMFEEIESYFQGSTVIHSGAMMATGEWYMAYKVQFDSELGYPVKFSGRPVTGPDAAVFDANFETTITELKVLKRQ